MLRTSFLFNQLIRFAIAALHDDDEPISVRRRAYQLYRVRLTSCSTGATGYIGGEVLHRLTKAAPKIDITALVRDAHKGSQLLRAYPNVHVVHGDLDDSILIEKTAEKADVVVRKRRARPL